MKRILSILTLMVLVFTVSTSTVFASNTTQVNKGVSTENPATQISLDSVAKPTKVWNISSKGRYEFGGTSQGQSLYTNYKFNGRDSYCVKVNNNCDYALTVSIMSGFKTLKTRTIESNTSQVIYLENIGSTKEFYIKYSGDDLDFSGFVEGIN